MLPEVTAATSLLPSAEQATALAPMTVPLVVQLVPMLFSRLPSRMVWLVFCAMIQPAAPLAETRTMLPLVSEPLAGKVTTTINIANNVFSYGPRPPVGGRQGRQYTTREQFLEGFRLRPAGTMAAPGILRHLAQHSAREFPDGTWRHKFDRNVYATRETTDGLPHWNRIRIPALLVKLNRQRLDVVVDADAQIRQQPVRSPGRDKGTCKPEAGLQCQHP